MYTNIEVWQINSFIENAYEIGLPGERDKEISHTVGPRKKRVAKGYKMGKADKEKVDDRWRGVRQKRSEKDDLKIHQQNR